MNHQEIVRECQDKVKATIRELLATAGRPRKMGPMQLERAIDNMPVRLSRRRAQRAGSYAWKGEGDIGRVLVNVLVCNDDERFRTTLLHEYAHAVARFMSDGRERGHGSWWRLVMNKLGLPPERCHGYEIGHIAALYKYSVVVICNCLKSKTMVGKKAKHVLEKTRTYTCLSCRTTVKPAPATDLDTVDASEDDSEADSI